jgi:4-hydroxybenzoyl-CoA thioesterase
MTGERSIAKNSKPANVSFTTRISIAFGDTDPAGLVYYPNIFHYCHLAMERFVRERAGISYSELISDQRIGFPTVSVQAEFMVPIVYGDEIDVEVEVQAIGNSSLTLGYSINRATDRTLCAKIEQVHVAMDLDTRKAAPLPNSLRESFSTKE